MYITNTTDTIMTESHQPTSQPALANPEPRLTFAHLPFELRDQIWRLAAEAEAESEQTHVHNLTVYNIKTEKASEHIRHGTIKFDIKGSESQVADSDTTSSSYALRFWGPVDGRPAAQGLANVCPESRWVVRKVSKAGKSLMSGVYTTKDGLAQNILMDPQRDLFFLNIFSPTEVDWRQVVREVPLFRQGVKHVAFQVDPAWYGCRERRNFHQFVCRLEDGKQGQRRYDTAREIKPLEHLAWSLAVNNWAETVWLIAPDLQREEPRWLPEVKEHRQVFYGNGCRYVEIRMEDVGIGEYPGWWYPRLDYTRKSIFALMDMLHYSAGSESWGRDPKLGAYSEDAFPRLGVLACERMT
jgi:hypothetical protein